MAKGRNFKLTSALLGENGESWVSEGELLLRYVFNLDLFPTKCHRKDLPFKKYLEEITAFCIVAASLWSKIQVLIIYLCLSL